MFSALFFVNSFLFGIGLAMDAFSVSLANGLNNSNMRAARMLLIAGVFAAFQFVMPMIGWFCVHSLEEAFVSFQKIVPVIALVLLLFIGIKMILDGFRSKRDSKRDDYQQKTDVLGMGTLIVQGIATSIDALSVGLTIAEFTVVEAFVESLIIGIVTFGICIVGLYIGRAFGTKLAGKASILGGSILVFIGVEIFVKSLM